MLQPHVGLRSVHITIMLMLCSAAPMSWAGSSEGEICNVSGDYALGLEDYSAAIALHRQFLRSHPDNALAHYHLGFAYSMTGRSSEEMREYLKAVSLGLRDWDLFLDLGLAYLDRQDYPNAVSALETSVLRGPQHPEAHFNLAFAHEKAARLSGAMREIIVALRMAPADPDIHNTRAIFCAESGDLKCAHDEWTLLLQVAPNYVPARMNFAILRGSAPQLRPSSPNVVQIPQLFASASWPNHKQAATPLRPAMRSAAHMDPLKSR
jgi:Flp pilus assembly protein TadD